MGTVFQSSIEWIPIPDDFQNDVKLFSSSENFFGMDKYYWENKFLTGVQLVMSDNEVRVRLYGNEIDSTSFALGLMTVSSKPSLHKSTHSVLEEHHLDGLKDGLASGVDIEYIDYKIKKEVTVIFGIGTAGKTLPFFDTNDVTFDIKSPVAGIGFYHYTNSDSYSGFIKPHLIALNYKSFIDPQK